MSSRIVKKPKIALREQEQATTGYSVINRNSSDGRGNQSDGKPFRDERTVIQEQNLEYAMPVGIYTSSYVIEEDPSLSTDISINGPVPHISLSYQYIAIRNELDPYRPYRDHYRYEDNGDAYISLSGSLPEESGILGLDQPLRTKTSFSIELPFTGYTKSDYSAYMGLTNSQLFYYDHSQRKFVDKINFVGTVPTTGDNSFGWDAALIHPMGFPVQSGSIEGYGEYIPNPHVGTTVLGGVFGNVFYRPTTDNFLGAITFRQSGSATINDDYIASNDELLNMSDYISHPFLLEKIIAEIPISINSSWFDLRTTINYATSSVGGNAIHSDVGGPAIFYGLMRQDGQNKRELICSGAIIPEGDNQTFISPSNDTGITYNPQTTVAGFSAYGTPNVVVAAPAGGADFTGSLTLVMDPAHTQGVMTTGKSFDGGTFFDSVIRHVAPAGYIGENNYLGNRNSFARGLSAPGEEKRNVPYTDDVHLNVYMFFDNKKSPYLIHPEDKLIFFVTSHRKVIANLNVRTTLTGSAIDINVNADYNSVVGTVDSDSKARIKMYGSTLSEAKSVDYFDLNQNLTTIGVHEVVGNEPIVDQFDTDRKNNYSGSYIDAVYSGSIFADLNTEFPRQRYASVVVGRPGVTGSLLRGVNIPSSNERYYDSLVPTVADISAVNNLTLITTSSAGSSWHIAKMHIGTTALGGDKFWPYGYPFQPRYASLQRYANPLKNTIASTDLDGTNIDPTVSNIVVPAYLGNPSIAGGRRALVEPTVKTQDDYSRIVKSYYGFGDNYSYKISTYTTRKTPLFKGASRVLTNTAGGFTARQDVEIRGWKYGLISATDYRISAVFRHDRYGQLRDMLEQRQDTKIYDVTTQNIRNSPIRIRFSEQEPEDTFASNLSLEATSSVPYYDGISLNRGDLPSTIVLGT